jgi:protein-L-isoaspartate(D-aspartate) O-methyltransferase
MITRREELAAIRRAYAKQVLFAGRVSGAKRVEDAFAAVPRETFFGPGPWSLWRWGRYVETPSDDPTYLYIDLPLEIDRARRINSGQPSLHARELAHVQPRPGEHVVHIGAGVGYITALLAHMAGREGRVTAIEAEADLAERARANLAPLANVTVLHADGVSADFEPADVVYLNAGATGPRDHWLDRLRDGGRLLLPLTTDKGFRAGEPGKVPRRGAVFVIMRDGDAWHARWTGPVEIYPCVSRDEAEEKALAEALERELPRRVTRFHRTPDIPDDQCWLRGRTWSFGFEPGYRTTPSEPPPSAAKPRARRSSPRSR